MADPNSKKLEDNEIVIITFQVAIRRSRKDGLEHQWRQVVNECGGKMTTQIKPANPEQTRTREFDRTAAPRRMVERMPITATLVLGKPGDEPKGGRQ